MVKFILKMLDKLVDFIFSCILYAVIIILHSSVFTYIYNESFSKRFVELTYYDVFMAMILLTIFVNMVKFMIGNNKNG